MPDDALKTPGKTWSVGTLVYNRKGLVILFFLLLGGDFVWALRDRSIGPITQLLFKNYGASDFLNGLMLSSIPCVIGMVLGPIISFRSDRFRSRLGRRIPFLLVTTPVVFGGMVGMAGSVIFANMLGSYFPGLTHNQMVLYLLGASWIFFEFGVIVAGVVFFALINDVVPQQLLGRFFGLFRFVSLLVGIVFNYGFFGYAEKNHGVVFGTLAVAYAIGITMMCCFVREGQYPPPPAKEPGKNNWRTAFEYLGRCARSPYYWLLFSMLTINGLVWLPSGTFIAFYAKQLQIDMDYFGKLGAYSYVVSLVLAYPLGAWVDRFHPLRCVMLTIGVYTVVTLLSGFFICDQKTFAIAMVTQSVVAGVYWTTSSSLTMRLFPRSQYAQYGIVGGFLGGIVNFFAVPLLGIYLDASGHAYGHTFFMASGLGVIALILMAWYFRYFNAYGGVKNYVAPEF